MTIKVPQNTDAPTPVKTPNTIGAYAEEIKSNASVTGNLNSQFKYNQTDEGPYHEMSKGASVNRYLEKIAKMSFDAHIGKASLGVSAASLGVGLANLHNNKKSANAEMSKVKLEQKSLSALHSINKTLSTASMHPSPVAVTPKKSYK
jgi:hypothetical protein